jgi:hypothetical protein
MSPKKICIVSCTAHKREQPMCAENLYCSDLFYKSRRFAHANFDGWLILSAKHGLLKPCDIVAPYECKLPTLTQPERRILAEQVSRQAASLFDPCDTEVTSICGEDYNDLLIEASISFRPDANFALPIGMKLQALGAATDPNKNQKLLESTYSIISRLAEKYGMRRLGDLMDQDMPASGVYLFFDDRERRLKDTSQMRVVRVGTHGVATGSKATLRNRMRTHFGTASGEGNHRSSIFRLHVGRSLMNAKLAPEIKSWAMPALDRTVLLAERELESAVSKYLANLFVLLIAVPGESDKGNDRAYLEQNLIALLSNEGKPLDPPSCEWLGCCSNRVKIQKSGIWNINHVDQRVDPAYLQVLDYYVSVTAGMKPSPEKQIAPSDWQARARDDARQLILVS